jgi:uncharacterized protein
VPVERPLRSPATAAGPARIVPLVLPGTPGDTRAPVRIFLGTEPAQYRAERVFCHALERIRDRTRRYEIYRMSGLAGFATRAWRTGFTNYRFAVPALAGATGRALYNDVDQIYTADPAGLFDMPLHGRGYLALSPEDTAVMLLDCARMAAVWSWTAARRGDKKALLAAAADAGLWGPLPARWHARDAEFRPGESALLHYTALHSQPWQPAPARYSYHPHPHGELWLALEREADAQRYEPYTAAQPSPGFARGCARLLTATPEGAFPAPGAAALAARLGCTQALIVGPATAPLWPGLPTTVIGPGGLRTGDASADLVAALALHVLDPDDVSWVIGELFARAGRLVVIHADLRTAAAPAACPEYWHTLVRRAARRCPQLCWQLALRDAGGGLSIRTYDLPARAAPPRVWLLRGRHAGDNAQLDAVAHALGWPCERFDLAFWPGLPRLPGWLKGATRLGLRGSRPPLAPPWPDLVLAAGRRSAGVARWVVRRSGGRTRSVLLGRPRAPLRAFDLVLSTPQYGLPARGNLMHLPGPFGTAAQAPDAAVATWRRRLARLPRPWLVALVGGSRRPYRFGVAEAHALGAALAREATARAGSVLVCGAPRTAPEALAALAAAVGDRAEVYRFRAHDPENPYRAWLALADALVVTGESASLLADAVATGKPVAAWKLPVRRGVLAGIGTTLGARLGVTTRASGSRGTPRQQDARGRLYDGLVAAGILNGVRDVEAVHAALGVPAFPAGLDAPPRPGAGALAGAHAEAIWRIRELIPAQDAR